MPLAMLDSKQHTNSIDDRRGLVADGAKVLGGFAILAAGLVITLNLSNSDAVRWLVFMGFPVTVVAAFGARFPPHRVNVSGAAILAGVAAAIWMAFASVRSLISIGFRSLLSILFSALLTGFVTSIMVWIFLGPLLAAIKAAGETRPSVWTAFGFSLLGYLVGGGALMGLFVLTKPVGLDLAVFFIPLVTGIWGTAGALYVLAWFRETGSFKGRAG